MFSPGVPREGRVKRTLAVLVLIFGVATWFLLQHYEFEHDGFELYETCAIERYNMTVFWDIRK